MNPYFQNASVTLYHGDCFDIMPAFAPGAFDMLCSDPPYGIGECEWDKPVDWPRFFNIANPLHKRNAAKVLFTDMKNAVRVVVANRQEFRYDLVYWKYNPSGILNSRRAPLRAHENILVFYGALPTYHPQMWQSAPYSKPKRQSISDNYTKGNVHEFAAKENETSRFPLSVIYHGFNPTLRKTEGTGHPTQKPAEMISWLIRSYTNEGDTILDPFAGSGTAGVAAAMRTGRKAVLIELEEKWCEMAAKRLEKETA